MQIEQIEEQRRYKVTKSNELARKAKADLTLSESKLMAFVFSKVHAGDTERTEYTIKISEYLAVIGIDRGGWSYDNVVTQIKKLAEKTFVVRTDSGEDCIIHWIERPVLNKRKGTIRVRLHPEIQDYIIGLYGNFTQYQLLAVLPMASGYSIRIYEILKSYSHIWGHRFVIEELKELLCCQGYKTLKDFKARVIEPAVAEINRYTDLEVAYEVMTQDKQAVTKGRKAHFLDFHIRVKDFNEVEQANRNATDRIKEVKHD